MPASRKKTAPTFAEPRTKWRKSKAKEILYDDLVDGKIPLVKQAGEDTHQYYLSRNEYQRYDPDKWTSRLDQLRETINFRYERARDDLEAYRQFKTNNPASLVSKKGYIQWKGSDAHHFLEEDLNNGLLESMSIQELYNARPEYYGNFPLDVFHDKVHQEIRTEKYLQTLKAKGKSYKAS